MSTGRVGPRLALVMAILTLVVAIVGFIVTLIVNAFVLDKFDAYGEVPIPGRATLHLPAGEATVSFHTRVTGQPASGFPVPPVQVVIGAPPGVPKPVLTEDYSGTTAVNSDVRVRIWVAHIAQDADYDIVARGEVGGYIDPRLAFGYDAAQSWLVWVFVGLFVLGLAELAVAVTWMARSGKTRTVAPQPPPNDFTQFDAAQHVYTPTDQGVRLEQLKTLTALRDSGALTQAEFEAEKRRILSGP